MKLNSALQLHAPKITNSTLQPVPGAIILDHNKYLFPLDEVQQTYDSEIDKNAVLHFLFDSLKDKNSGLNKIDTVLETMLRQGIEERYNLTFNELNEFVVPTRNINRTIKRIAQMLFEELLILNCYRNNKLRYFPITDIDNSNPHHIVLKPLILLSQDTLNQGVLGLIKW